MLLHNLFTWSSNLEFTFYPQSQEISDKVLYRAYGNTQKFKNTLYNYLQEEYSSSSIKSQIADIFSLEEVQNVTFHYGEDTGTQRKKFYISLHNMDFKLSLIILSKLKKIIWLKEYILEADFWKFDCIGFDIRDNEIHLKVYEIYAHREKYYSSLPEYISPSQVKEVWILKSWKRRKLFFRLKKPCEIPFDFFPHKIKKFSRDYEIRWKMTYYCREGDSEEIYFI